MVSNHNNLDFHLNMEIALGTLRNSCPGDMLVHPVPYIPFKVFEILKTFQKFGTSKSGPMTITGILKPFLRGTEIVIG